MARRPTPRLANRTRRHRSTVRDEALTPLIVSSGRKLKRVLADEQNDVLDRLRGKQAVRSIDDLLPAVDDQAARYFGVHRRRPERRGDGWAESLGGSRRCLDRVRRRRPGRGPRRRSPTIWSQPLRDRLAVGIEAVDGDNEELTKKARAIYREWKTKHIDDELDNLLRHAYGRGALHCCRRPGQPVRWVFDPTVGACSDCEDNSLQGAIAAGTAFPTGHVCAPAHAGCRCLIVRAD